MRDIDEVVPESKRGRWPPSSSSAARSRRAGSDESGRKVFGLGKALKHPLADYGFLLGATTLLQLIGLVMVLSASTVVSLKISKGDSSYVLFIRQLMFAVIGFMLMLLLSRMPVEFFRRMAMPILLASFAGLVLVFVPGVGKEVNGQQNWIGLFGPFNMQPSEFAKLALIIWTADLLARKHSSVEGMKTLLWPLWPAALAIFLILAEKDLGTCMVIIPALAAILLVAGAPKKIFAVGSVLLVLLITAMSLMPAGRYRLKRFASWLDPASDPTGTGWQIIHGQYALASGGWWGLGLGASREKWGFLPEAQTDFIVAVIGEELGLMGTLSVLVLFASMALVVGQIALQTEDMFVRLATTGVGVWIILQAVINVGAVVGALPITGLPLPLVSYGGSSLTFTLMAVGMLLAFSRAQPRARAFLAERADLRPDNRRIGRRAQRDPRQNATPSRRRPSRRQTEAKQRRVDVTDSGLRKRSATPTKPVSDRPAPTKPLAEKANSGRRLSSGRRSRHDRDRNS